MDDSCPAGRRSDAAGLDLGDFLEERGLCSIPYDYVGIRGFILGYIGFRLM